MGNIYPSAFAEAIVSLNASYPRPAEEEQEEEEEVQKAAHQCAVAQRPGAARLLPRPTAAQSAGRRLKWCRTLRGGRARW